MKHSITKRLVLTNLSILFIALLFFFGIIAFYFNRELHESASAQLRAENISMLKQFSFQGDYERILEISELTNLEDAIHIFGRDVFEANHFEILAMTKEAEQLMGIDHDLRDKIASLPKGLPTTMIIDGEKYIVIVTSYGEFMNENAVSIGKEGWDAGEKKDIVLVSILSIAGVRTLMLNNIIIFIGVLLLITLISYYLMKKQSQKITAPLEQLSKVADEYAGRNFDNKIVIQTGDEIESLSNSISKMVEGLTSYEQSQIILFRNLSHELKTPLAAINGYAEAILDGHYKESIIPPLKIISEESMRIKTILEDLIFLSKMDSNSEVFNFKEQNLVATLTSGIEKIESIAILNDIDIDYNPNLEIITTCDENKMLRLFINILSNALKYANERIEIRMTTDENQSCISILDDGAGFDASMLDKLFEKSTGETLTGSGLGLIIVKEIADRHHFNVVAENTHQGAKVSLIIEHNKRS